MLPAMCFHDNLACPVPWGTCRINTSQALFVKPHGIHVRMLHQAANLSITVAMVWPVFSQDTFVL